VFGVRRHELAHLLRTACAIARGPEVLGSQAILGTYDDEPLASIS